MEFFRYGTIETDYLKDRDPVLGAVIDRIGPIRRPVMPDLFAALVNSIVGQQISPKAADTVWNRMLKRFGTLSPGAIHEAAPEEIQRCGLSLRKAGTIKAIAEKVVNGECDLSALAALPDDEVIRRLSALPGIGVWSSEMLLIFSLHRQDVVSFGDLAIRRGMMKVYGLAYLTKEEFHKIRGRYSPYGTVASLYLWEAAKEDA